MRLSHIDRDRASRKLPRKLKSKLSATYHGLSYKFVRDEMPWVTPVYDNRGFCIGYADNENEVVS